MKVNKKLLLLIFFSIIMFSTSFSKGVEDFALKKEELIPIQTKYDSLTDVVPSYIMLHATGTSMISQEVLDAFQDKMYRSMINTEKIKPVLLDKWLITKYGLEKEKNIQKFVSVLANESYLCNVVGVCNPYLFETSDGYAIMLSFYNFEKKGFPITVFRKIESLAYCTEALNAMFQEFIAITTDNSNKLYNKKKIIVKPFVLESRKYLGQTSGEFDYIPSTFIEQDGVLIRSTDDIFSRLLGYSLNTTQMVDAVSALDIQQFVEPQFDTYDFADFYIEGRIQLTDQINIFHIVLYDAKTKKEIKNTKYFSSDFSLEGIWLGNNNIVYSLADSIFGKDSYGICPDIRVPGQGMFLNNMFVGWDNLEKFVLPKGKHFIYTGTYLIPDANMEVKNKDRAVDINGESYKSFFLYLDDRNWLFRGKDGERVWNLLEK